MCIALQSLHMSRTTQRDCGPTQGRYTGVWARLPDPRAPKQLNTERLRKSTPPLLCTIYLSQPSLALPRMHCACFLCPPASGHMCASKDQSLNNDNISMCGGHVYTAVVNSGHYLFECCPSHLLGNIPMRKATLKT